jgi:hypothetical protein
MKKQTKRQGIALVVSTKKKPAKKAVKRVTKKRDPAKDFTPEDPARDYCKQYKDFTPVGTVFFEPFIGPAKITKIEKWTSRSVMLTIEAVLGDANSGEISTATRRIEKHYMPKAFDVKKFLKEINSLYKKTYLS